MCGTKGGICICICICICMRVAVPPASGPFLSLFTRTLARSLSPPAGSLTLSRCWKNALAVDNDDAVSISGPTPLTPAGAATCLRNRMRERGVKRKRGREGNV